MTEAQISAERLIARLEEQRNTALTSAAQAWALVDTLQEQLRLRDERLGELGDQLAGDDSIPALRREIELREAEIVRLRGELDQLKAGK